MVAQRGLWSGSREVTVTSIRVKLSSYGKVLKRQEQPLIPKPSLSDSAICLGLQGQDETQSPKVSSQPQLLQEPGCLSL